MKLWVWKSSRSKSESIRASCDCAPAPTRPRRTGWVITSFAIDAGGGPANAATIVALQVVAIVAANARERDVQEVGEVREHGPSCDHMAFPRQSTTEAMKPNLLGIQVRARRTFGWLQSRRDGSVGLVSAAKHKYCEPDVSRTTINFAHSEIRVSASARRAAHTDCQHGHSPRCL